MIYNHLHCKVYSDFKVCNILKRLLIGIESPAAAIELATKTVIRLIRERRKLEKLLLQCQMKGRVGTDETNSVNNESRSF